MKLTFLGTGTSTGVPSIACDCETCTSDDSRDKRLRVSVLIEHRGQSVLIDTSADFRQQALRYGLKRLDAVLITHCHADHIFGLDDIRPLNFRYGALGVYANERAWVDITRIFKYVFEYLTDLSEIPRETIDALQGLDVLVLDCLRFREHPTHLWVDKALGYVDQIKPRRTFFTHIAHDIKHEPDSAKLPAGVHFAYDGLVLESN